MTNYYLDTSAWIAYFRDSNSIIVEIIENNIVIFSDVVLIEIADFFFRAQQDPAPALTFIETHGLRMFTKKNTVIFAAKTKAQQRKNHPKFGIIDATHYAIAIENKATFVTTDKDFSSLSSVKIIS